MVGPHHIWEPLWNLYAYNKEKSNVRYSQTYESELKKRTNQHEIIENPNKSWMNMKSDANMGWNQIREIKFIGWNHQWKSKSHVKPSESNKCKFNQSSKQVWGRHERLRSGRCWCNGPSLLWPDGGTNITGSWLSNAQLNLHKCGKMPAAETPQGETTTSMQIKGIHNKPFNTLICVVVINNIVFGTMYLIYRILSIFMLCSRNIINCFIK